MNNTSKSESKNDDKHISQTQKVRVSYHAKNEIKMDNDAQLFCNLCTQILQISTDLSMIDIVSQEKHKKLGKSTDFIKNAPQKFRSASQKFCQAANKFDEPLRDKQFQKQFIEFASCDSSNHLADCNLRLKQIVKYLELIYFLTPKIINKTYKIFT